MWDSDTLWHPSWSVLPPLSHAPFVLQARGVGFADRHRVVLSAIDLELAPGSCTLVLGDNGAGKSTLLQVLQGRLPISGGALLLQGRPLVGQRRRLALVPQAAAVRWHYPIDLEGFVALGGGRDRPVCQAALRLVGLASLARRPIAQLSGGQRQRALIARAVHQNADVLLLDEPLASLDAASRLQLGDLISRLTETGRAIVLTAHGELPATLPPLRRFRLHQGCLQPLPPSP